MIDRCHMGCSTPEVKLYRIGLCCSEHTPAKYAGRAEPPTIPPEQQAVFLWPAGRWTAKDEKNRRLGKTTPPSVRRRLRS